MDISPKYQMQLIPKIEEELWGRFKSYKNVQYYIEKWQIYHDLNNWNFGLFTKDNSNDIDLTRTLHNMDGETLVKIAVDMEVDTPDFLPCIPIFKNDLKLSYTTALDAFTNAQKNVEEHPDVAIGLSNAALESILKHILQDERIITKLDPNKTLYMLAQDVLKEFGVFPSANLPKEIKAVGSGLLKITQSIETLRSNNTHFHGKATGDYIIKDSVYAYFIVNSITTVGMFLNSFYQTNFPKELEEVTKEDDYDDLPF